MSSSRMCTCIFGPLHLTLRYERVWKKCKLLIRITSRFENADGKDTEKLTVRGQMMVLPASVIKNSTATLEGK